MRLTIRDLYATAFVFIGMMAAFSVLAGWSWPLINGVRMGTIALGLAGIFACSVSGWGEDVAARRTAWTNPFIVLGSALGAVTLVVGVIALFTDQTVYLASMIAAMIALWLVTVTHRLFAGSSGRQVTPA